MTSIRRGIGMAVSERAIARMVRHVADAPIESVSRVGAAVANDVFVVQLSGDRRVVLRVLRNQTPEGVEREIALQEALGCAGLHTPRFLRLASGEVLGEDAGRMFTVMEYVAGSSECTMSVALAEDFGRTLARFHRATAGLHFDDVDDVLNPGYLAREMAQLHDQLPALRRLLARTSTLFESDLPRAMIHGDLYLENVFVEGDHVTTVLDLESAEVNVRLLDVAQSSLSVADAARISPLEAGHRILRGYDELEPVTPGEQGALPMALRYAAAANAAWLFAHDDPVYGASFVRVGESIDAAVGWRSV